MNANHTYGKHAAMRLSAQSADTIDSLLAHYVAGNLPRPMNALVGAHLEIRDTSRALVRNLEGIAGNELEHMQPAPLSNRDAMLASILASASPALPQRPEPARSCKVMPRALQDFIGLTAEELPWRTKLPGFKEYYAGEMDGCEYEFLWIRPGRAMPKHTHGGTELTLVLDGGFGDDTGHYVRGDIAAADELVDHRPVADDDTPCICFAVTTAPLKLTGSFGQLFSDIFGR